MKHLFVLLIFISLKNGLQAQVTDSTTMRSDSAQASNMTDSASAANINSPSTSADSSKMDSMHTTMSNGTDSMSNSSNNAMSNSNSTPGNTGAVQNPMNEKGMQGYAALPVMESYVPDDVMDKIKSKYGNGTVIYDITAVRASMPTDSAAMQQPTDSSSTQQLQPDSASAMAMSTVPVKYNYVVRTIKDGTIQTECLADDGTTVVTPGEMNKPQQ